MTSRPPGDQAPKSSSTPNISSVERHFPTDLPQNDTHVQHRLSHTYRFRPQNETMDPSVGEYNTECRWLLVCARKDERSTSLSQMSVCTTASDRELFTALRTVHLGLKKRWRRILSLRSVQAIRFVQVGQGLVS